MRWHGSSSMPALRCWRATGAATWRWRTPRAPARSSWSRWFPPAARGFDDIVRRLLDAGVDGGARYGNDLTAVMWAAGHDEGVGAPSVEHVLDLLLAHGGRLDDADNRGRTALMIAAELGYAPTVD